MKLKKKETTNKIYTPNIQVVFSLLLFFISFVFSLCIGQKAYDPDEVGFMLTYFVPGVMAILVLADASIEYIDGKKGSLWSSIASVALGVVEAGFSLYVASSYFTKYPQTPESMSSKYLTLAALILFLLVNVFARNIKIVKQLREKTSQIPFIHVGFFIAAAIASGFVMSAYKIYDPSYSGIDTTFTTVSFIANLVFAVASTIVSYIKIDDKYRDSGLIFLSIISVALSAITILMIVNVSEFGPTTFYRDYWSLVSLGFAAIALAIPTGYMGYLISKKKEA